MAASLQSQGKQDAAVQPIREALGILLKQRNQKEDSKLPSTVRGLANLLVSQGRPSEGTKLYEELLQGARQALGESHPVLGEIFHDYGEFLFFQQNNFAAAVEQYQRSLPMRRAKEDDHLAWTLRNLGFALVCAEKPKEAEEYLRESLALYRKLHQEDHLHGTAWASVWLGDALYRQQRLPEAERVYCEAMVAFSKTQGIVGEGYNALPRLIRVLTEENKSAEAETLLKDVLSRQRESPGGQQNTTITSLLPSLTESIRILLAKGEFARAEPLARECLASHEKLMPDDWRTFDIKSMLGGSLLGQKQYAAAEPLLLSGCQGMKQRETHIPLSGKPRLKEGLQRLVKLYEVTGRFDQVAEWKQRLIEFDQVEGGKKAAAPQP